MNAKNYVEFGEIWERFDIEGHTLQDGEVACLVKGEVKVYGVLHKEDIRWFLIHRSEEIGHEPGFEGCMSTYTLKPEDKVCLLAKVFDDTDGHIIYERFYVPISSRKPEPKLDIVDDREGDGDVRKKLLEDIPAPARQSCNPEGRSEWTSQTFDCESDYYFLMPVTEQQRDFILGREGMHIFNTTTRKRQVFAHGRWVDYSEETCEVSLWADAKVNTGRACDMWSLIKV